MKHQTSIFWLAEHHAKVSAQTDCDMDSMTAVETLPCSLSDYYQLLSQHGSCGKMSLVYCPTTADEPLENSPIKYKNAGIVAAGVSLTLSISESPKNAVESTLSDIMIGDAPLKYYLTEKCRSGLISRNQRHTNKVIPRLLLRALQMSITSELAA